MPISKLLPDGRVEIFNSNTGEIRQVSPEELPQYNAKMVVEYQKLKDLEAQKQAQIQLAEQGSLPDTAYAEIVKNDPQTALELTKGGYQAPTSSADKKLKQQAEGILGLTDELKRAYNTPLEGGQRPDSTRKDSLAKGGDTVMAPINAAMFEFSQVMSNKNVDAKTYKRLKEGFTASLKELTGDTGILTDQDYTRIAAALPDFSDSDKSARGAWESIDRILKSKFGSAGQISYIDQKQPDIQPQQSPTQSGFPQESMVQGINIAPSSTTPGKAVQVAEQRAKQQSPQKGLFERIFGPQGPIGGALAPAATSPAGDVVAGLFEMINPSLSRIAHKRAANQQLTGGDVVGGAGDVAMSVLPWLRGVKGAGLAARATGNVARNAAAGGIQGATAPDQTASERLNNALFKGGTGAAIAGAFNAPGFLKNKIIPTKAGSSMRDAAIVGAEEAGKTIAGDTLAQGMQDWAETALKANPGKEKQINQVLNSTLQQYRGKNLTPKEAFKIWNEVDSGFTRTGVTKTSIESSADRALRDSLRKSLDMVAPGFEKGTKTIAKGLKRSEFLKKSITPTILGSILGAAAGVPATMAITSVLGGRK